MRTRIAPTLAVFASLLVASPTCAADDSAITSLRLQVSDRTTEPLLTPDKPWEDFTLGYCQVIRPAADRWQMWYAAYDHAYKNDADGRLCYAASADGVHWKKPELGLVDYDGSRQNNIVLDRGTHGACVFLDAAARSAERYKLACVKLTAKRWPIYGGVSPDGVHWTLGDKPLLDHNSDTQQSCFRDGDAYRLYVRQWSGPRDFTGHRLVGASRSKTFGNFPPPQPILAADEHDPPNVQFYNAAASKLRDRLYLMLPSGFYTGEDIVRIHAAASHDGEHFHRLGPRPLVELGPGFDSMAMYAAPGALPADKPNQYWIYYYGSSAGHDHTKPDRLKSNGGIGRFLLTIKEPEA